MSFLHIIAPSSVSASPAMTGLMHIATKRLPFEHNVLVLGDAKDTEHLRNLGLSILGSVQGTDNNSRTLGERLRRVLEKIASKKDQLIAWGWTPAVAVSGIDCAHRVVAFIDSIDSGRTPEIEVDHVIPTTWTCGERFKNTRGSRFTVTEPLVGIDRKTLIVDQRSVFDGLNISPNCMLMAAINNEGRWQEIVEVIVMLWSVGVQMYVVVSSQYLYYGELYFALKEHKLSHVLRRAPVGLRLIDVVHGASCIWVPSSMMSGKLDGVLDVLSATATGVPVAASCEHAITGVPTIGHRIGWVSSIVDLCAWIVDIAQDPTSACDQALEIATRVRSIASPARFVEGLQLRL